MSHEEEDKFYGRHASLFSGSHRARHSPRGLGRGKRVSRQVRKAARHHRGAEYIGYPGCVGECDRAGYRGVQPGSQGTPSASGGNGVRHVGSSSRGSVVSQGSTGNRVSRTSNDGPCNDSSEVKGLTKGKGHGEGVRVWTADGIGVLTMRGGGIDRGAGVLAWLYESDDENVQTVMDDWDRRHAHEQLHLHQWRPDLQSGEQPAIIHGHNGGLEVIICNGCYRDVFVGREQWQYCACGIARCGECLLRECPRCGREASRDEQGRPEYPNDRLQRHELTNFG